VKLPKPVRSDDGDLFAKDGDLFAKVWPKVICAACKIRVGINARSLPAAELRGYTITPSNFGMIVVKPSRRGAPTPTVAMLTGGEARRFLAAGIAGPQRTR
jgi:hypothetical protein